MHDRNGVELHEGDRVIILGRVAELQAGRDFCNVTVETEYGRQPDGLKDTYCTNTRQLVKLPYDDDPVNPLKDDLRREPPVDPAIGDPDEEDDYEEEEEDDETEFDDAA